MSNQRIIITLSADNIAMAYAKGETPRLPEQFPGSSWPMPLENFDGSEAAYPSYRIGRGVDERVRALYDEGILTDDDDEAGFKDDLEVLLLTENDLTDEDIANAKADLERWGFKNLRTIHPYVAVAEYYCSGSDVKGLVIASSNGRDLSISLLKRESPATLGRYTLKGLAQDGRVEAVATKIWDLVKDNTLGLSYSSEAPVLRKIAADFLRTSGKELEGSVRLSDGVSYDFFLIRSSLKNLSQGDSSLRAKFTDILLDNDMADRSAFALILRGDAVGNQYLKEMLTDAFSKVEEESESFREAVGRHLAGKEWTRMNDEAEVKAVSDEKKVKEPEKKNEKKNEKKTGTKLIPVNITASVEREGSGFLGLFNKKSVLKINIDIPDRVNLPWKSVLCVLEDPLSTIDPRFVVKEYPREERPPFAIDLDLPLKSCPNAKKLRVYFLPSPDEPVGINNVYDVDPAIVKLK